ncbi:MAG: ATP-dependent endonuclease [Thiothrix lacustris]|uniref:ATP-dependent endonuclease n=1 Tax=Thiothrix lacustris TaxID=525917 RepID=A0A1Y1QAZ4_9GAMM|nr:MAG: ATP-dependent endonuclease [Thiothrix lacustris]
MYISGITINGFRNFKDKEVLFNDGVNVIIGPNNVGKTNLIKALSLVIDHNGSKKLNVHDFNKHISLDEIKAAPPKVSIVLTIMQSNDEELNSDDLVTVSNWLVKLDVPYEARLTYEFFLPEKEHGKYREFMRDVDSLKKAWQVIDYDFIRLYIHKIFGGNANLQNPVDGDSLQKFDFQFLDAIRDVERDMFSGRHQLLKEVLGFFIDYEIKGASNKTIEEKQSEIRNRRNAFSEKADELLRVLQERMSEGKKNILSYAEETGASFNNAVPDFEGTLSDVELFSALKLIVEHETNIKIPATHNGLGYNNLIYMSLLLAKMQVNSDGEYLGSNAKVFPILVIEEPEAHLHPAMQYKFLKFLKNNKDYKKKVRQVFVTSHSTQITSAVLLDEIICLHYENDSLSVGYPGKVFPDSDEGKKAKAYVQRFLDATKSDMLFSQRVILVEGLAEQLLLSLFAEYSSVSLEDNHVAVVNVGGRYFNYFLYLFDSEKSIYAIPKKIVCLTDRDPERKKITGNKYEKCYSFEYAVDSEQYAYKNNADDKINQYLHHANIRFFSQDVIYGKTFETEIVLYNPSSDFLLVESIANKGELMGLMNKYKDDINENSVRNISEYVSLLRSGDENKQIIDGICNSSLTWNDEDKIKALIASRYLNSVGKGENALELAYFLENNLKKEISERLRFVVPTYISNAINWVCQ